MENPLKSPALPLPFDRITSEHIEPAISQHLAKAQSNLDAVANANPLTYDSTFLALEKSTEELEIAMGVVEHLESVKTSPALRAAYNAVQPRVSEFYSGIALHEGVYRALRAYAEKVEAEGIQALSETQRRFMK